MINQRKVLNDEQYKILVGIFGVILAFSLSYSALALTQSIFKP
ncbi:unnamed protein product (macronuclear) [Paramecium tetraurelia]|uniref:Uncharacterized protein n=1 Tax=Paramecium tetraurelia TaxID=5888 RepID=A0BJM3_PARTE|nr:uncharacterized protein GSPATT00029368001 [Paramecium tetraurelia]CAK58740.1 unnamed protein product [Paramecium tetraurelia]